jgi:flagellar hook-basal body complex protein FliE
MVDGIGSLAREALAAAQRVSREGSSGVGAPDFAQALQSGLERVEGAVQSAESLPIDLLTGKISDFHEIAVQLKDAELSFKFAMEIRNKLIDAYREIMRMSV